MNNPIHNSKFPIHNSQLNNPNTLYAHHFVHALAQAGLTAVCISPGSRSTPLTLAFDAHPDIKVHVMLDERSGGFFALGMALATDSPVALLCTSGTAVANYLPAIIEAKMSHVPLLILTADRPPELRHSGANQTIDQIKIYGDQVLWSVDLPLPQPNSPDVGDIGNVALRNLHTLATRAHATANGLPKGPVHLNFPFRKPLEPVDSANSQFTIHNSQFTIQRGQLLPTRPQLDQIASLINQYPNGLIICGPRCPGGNFPQAVAGLSQMSGYPTLADSISGVRFGAHVAETAVISSYETFLNPKTLRVFGKPLGSAPDVIIRFGALPISKWLNDYMSRVDAKQRIHIRENGVWADDSHTTTFFLQANEELFCYETAVLLTPRLNSTWEREWMAKETAVWQSINQAIFEPYFDASVIADVVEMLPENSTLFMGNSLPIRHLDQFGQAQPKRIYAVANRGASGIDGNVSTALGIAAATHRPLVAILGDITFYHDMNGLLAISGQQSAISNAVTFIIINNNGGGIFKRLPIAQFEPPFTKLFTTPHGLQFEHTAKLYGLEYYRVTEREAFKRAFAQPHHAPKLIEVFTNGRFDHERRQEIT